MEFLFTVLSSHHHHQVSHLVFLSLTSLVLLECQGLLLLVGQQGGANKVAGEVQQAPHSIFWEPTGMSPALLPAAAAPEACEPLRL